MENLWKAADRVPLVPGDDGGIDAGRRPSRPFCLHVCGSVFLSPTQDADAGTFSTLLYLVMTEEIGETAREHAQRDLASFVSAETAAGRGWKETRVALIDSLCAGL